MPVAVIQNKIAALRQSGARIIFISDMYLPRKIIMAMLVKHALALPGDAIYVSGDIGLNKASGKLFTHVLNQERITAGQLLHCGDNIWSDFAVPRRLGIHAELFKAAGWNRFETKARISFSDPLLATRLSGISRASRLANCQEGDNPLLAGIVSGVIAPLLYWFVAWVIADAQKKGISRLYFVSRDGQILYEIARIIGERQTIPECRYLYGSRQAWYLPSLEKCCREEMDWLVIDGHSKSPEHLLRKLDIQSVEISESLAEWGLAGTNFRRQLTGANIENFWKMLALPKVRELIEHKVAVARQITIDYFIQEGLTQVSTWALVDIGWTLKTQRALRRILAGVGSGERVQGYYLGLSRERISRSESGPYRAFLLQEHCDFAVKPLSEYLFRYARVIEQVFTMADHGSVQTYRRNGQKVEPLCKPFNPGHNQRQYLQLLRRNVCFYSRLMGACESVSDQSQPIKELCLAQLQKFLATPSRQEVQALNWIVIGDDQNESRQALLARELKLKDFFILGNYLLRRQHDFPPDYAWLEGCLALSSPLLRMLFNLANWLRQTSRRLWLLRMV